MVPSKARPLSERPGKGCSVRHYEQNAGPRITTMTIAAICCVLYHQKTLLREPDFLCTGMFSTFQDCSVGSKNLLDTPASKFFAGRVARP